MKYSPLNYAKAFAALAEEAKTEAAQTALVKNLIAVLEKNRDVVRAPKIVAAAEHILRTTSGHDLYEIESARPLDASVKRIAAMFGDKNTTVRTTVNPDLVAGIRIMKNGEEQLDATLHSRLNTIFKSA